MIAFWFWPGLSPQGSGRTPGCTCKRTSSRAHSSAPGRRGPAAGGSLPASCGQRASLTDTSRHVEAWNHSVGCANSSRRAHSAELKASWKFSLGLRGLRVEYSKASGKKRCTRAQKAMPSFQLEEKFWMFTPCFRAESWKTQGAATQNKTRMCVEWKSLGEQQGRKLPGNTSIFQKGRSAGRADSDASSPQPSSLLMGGKLQRQATVSEIFVFVIFAGRSILSCSACLELHMSADPRVRPGWYITGSGSLASHEKVKVLC